MKLILNESLEERMRRAEESFNVKEDIEITDTEEVPPAVVTLEEPTPIEVRNGIADMINALIKSEYDAVTDYNNAITTMTAEGKYENLIAVFEDILREENRHIGQLQEALKEVSDAASQMEAGREEGESQLKGEETEHD